MKHKYNILLIFLASLFLSIAVMTYNADTNDSISLYDYHGACNYSVSYSESLIKIDSSEGSVNLTFDSDDFDCYVYNGVFVFLSPDPLHPTSDNTKIVTIFDSQTRYLSSFATDKNFNLSPALFACDENYNIYLCDKDDSSVIYKFSSSGNVTLLSCPVPVRQIMCTEDSLSLFFTWDGVYTQHSRSLALLSGSVIHTPCVMKSETEFVSADSKDYHIENGILNEVAKIPETEAPETPAPENHRVTIKDNLILAEQGITVAKLRKVLGLKSDEMVVYRVDGKVISSGRLGTGMRVLYNESEKQIVIKGDLTGEGNVNSRDLKLMMKFLTQEKTPDRLQKIAGNLDSDNTITIRDLLFLSKMYQ